MTTKQFKEYLKRQVNSSYKYYVRALNDTTSIAYKKEYGRYEMAKNILDKFEDFVKSNKIRIRQ